MSHSGPGTRECPIIIDEDSGDEMVTEPYSFLHRTSSPRPHTFLSAMPHLSEASVRTLQQFREALQEQVRAGKRKREPDSDSDTINNQQHGKHMAGNPVTGRSPTVQKGGKSKITEPSNLERKAEVGEGAVAQAKGKQKATLGPPAVIEERQQQPTSHLQISVSTSTYSQDNHRAKRIKHTDKPQSGPPAPTAPPPTSSSVISTRVPSGSSSMTHQAIVQPPAPPKPPPVKAPTPVKELLSPEPPFEPPTFSGFSQVTGLRGMPEPSFDPQHPPPYMNMCVQPPQPTYMHPPHLPPFLPRYFPPTFAPLPLPSMSIPPAPPEFHQPVSYPWPHPPLHPLASSSAGSDPHPQDQNTTVYLNPEKPFTLRQAMQYPPLASTHSTLTLLYIPIGKPDFRSNHGIFPILPTVMPSQPFGPSTSTTAPQKLYIPVIGNTLVMENIPVDLCDLTWISEWSLSACGVLPKKIFLGFMRALIEFPSSEIAITAWASPKLGVDEFGRRMVEDGEPKEFTITVYWWRPDSEGEKKVLRGWNASSKLSPEVRTAINDKLERLEKGSNKMAVVNKTTSSISTTLFLQQAKTELVDMARRQEFEVKLAAMINAGVDEGEIEQWEQVEIARIERKVRVMSHQQSMVREKARLKKENAVLKSPTNARRDEKQRPVKGEIKSPKLDSPLHTSHPQVTAQPLMKPKSVFPQNLASNTPPSNPMFTLVSKSTSTTLVSGAPKTPLFSLPSSTNSNIPPASASTSHPKLFFGLDKAHVGTSSNLRPFVTSPFLPATTPALPTPTSESVAYPNSSTKTPVFGKPSLGSTLWTSPATTAPSLPHKLTPSIIAFPGPQKGAPSVPLQSSNTIKLESTDTKLAMLDQNTMNELRGTHPKEELKMQAPIFVSSASRTSACNDRPLELSTSPNITVTTPASTTPTTVTSARPAGANIPRGIAEIELPEESRKPRQAVVMQRPRPSVCTPTLASRSSTSAVNLPTPINSVKGGPAESNRSKSEQRAPGIVCGLIVPSPATSDPSSLNTPTPATVSPHVSPVDMDISSSPAEDIPIKVWASNAITTAEQNVVQQQSRQQSPASIPKPVRNVAPAALEALKKILVKPVEERQQFLDREFKMTKALMANLATANKDRKKMIMKLWEEKIRIIDEVTKSIKNDNRVWYSNETRTWIRMRWPSGIEDTEAFMISDDED